MQGGVKMNLTRCCRDAPGHLRTTRDSKSGITSHIIDNTIAHNTVVQNSPSINVAYRDVAKGLTFGNNVDKQDHSQRIESIGTQESGTAGCRAREILPADKKYRGHGSRENRRGVRAVDEPTSATVRSVLRKDKDGAGCGQDCEGGPGSSQMGAPRRFSFAM